MDKPYQPALRPHAGATGLTSSAPPAALSHALHALIADPAIAAAFNALTGATLTEVVVDWPRSVAPAALGHWLRAGDALVELTRTPTREPLELALVLHADGATRLVERVLGASASSALASAVGSLSEAECGVLAYAVARLCAAHATELVVRDVRVVSASLALPAARVLWPLTLRSDVASFTGFVLLAPALAASGLAVHRVELLLRDALEGDAPLARGEVLVSDRWTLTDTTEGLTGPVRLAAPGTATELSAQLARGIVTVTGPAPTASPGDLTLVLATRALPLDAIAALTAGTPCAFPDVGRGVVLLRRGDAVLAEGELIVHRGALGLRITAT